ncbi:MAG: hypothetical protein QXH87_05750 [Candidatus Bathyarchaeia archaeon]
MSIIPERKKSRRGRPRTKTYIKVADFLNEFERIKLEYLRLKRIAETLHGATVHKIEPYGTGRYRNEKEILKVRDKGEFFKCPKCGAYCVGKEMVIDLEHDPPRIRLPLECGHWLDLALKPPKKCPKCGGELQIDQDGFKFCVYCDWKESPEFWE